MAAVETELTDPGAPADAATTADAIPLRLRRRGAAPRQVLAMTLVGTLVLAALASHDLSTWLDRMGDGKLLAPLQHAAAEWDAAMDRLGLTAPAEALRETIRRLLDWQWPGS